MHFIQSQDEVLLQGSVCHSKRNIFSAAELFSGLVPSSPFDVFQSLQLLINVGFQVLHQFPFNTNRLFDVLQRGEHFCSTPEEQNSDHKSPKKEHFGRMLHFWKQTFLFPLLGFWSSRLQLFLPGLEFPQSQLLPLGLRSASAYETRSQPKYFLFSGHMS